MNHEVRTADGAKFRVSRNRALLFYMVFAQTLCCFGLFAAPPTPQKFQLTGPFEERFVRRIYLDLTGALPTDDDVAEFQAPDFDLLDKLTVMLATETAATSLSFLSNNIFHTNPADLPDFERFIAAGDSALSANLDAPTRIAVTEEPRFHLRQLLIDQAKPQQMFSGVESYFNADARDFWNLGSGSAAGTSDDPYYHLRIEDGRPAIGMAASHGFLATIDSHSDSTGRRKAANFIARTACLDFDSVEAHNFKDVPSESLGASLRNYSESNATCASCHIAIKQLAGSMDGISQISDFSTWKRFDTPSATSGYYAGHRFNSTASFADKFSKDPSIRQCMIKRTISAVFQRRFDDSYDYENLLTIQGLLDLEGTSFNTALRYLLISTSYAQAPMNSQTAVSLRNRISGFRFLQKHHFDGIATQILGDDHQIGLSHSLNLRSFDSLDSESMMPTVEYHAAATSFLRSLADKTAILELSADSTAETRVIFKSLPAGTPSEISSDQLKDALAEAWRFLIRTEPDPTSPGFVELISLFDTVKKAEGSIVKAFEAALSGILLDPNFLSY
jgi:hypothetical protein